MALSYYSQLIDSQLLWSGMLVLPLDGSCPDRPVNAFLVPSDFRKLKCKVIRSNESNS